MESTMKHCTGMEKQLAEMLLSPDSVPAKVKTHVAECESCRQELEELRTTMTLLDSWEAPEPSPYFMTRFNARLDEERAAPPAGWLEKLRARLAYGPRIHARPLAAMALTVVVLLGGGAYLGISNWTQPATPRHSTAVVKDLQLLDNNAQLLDQLESISGNEN